MVHFRALCGSIVNRAASVSLLREVSIHWHHLYSESYNQRDEIRLPPTPRFEDRLGVTYSELQAGDLSLPLVRSKQSHCLQMNCLLLED